MTRLRLLLWPAGAALGIAAEWVSYGWGNPGKWMPDLLAGWTLIACGLVGWSWRTESRSGALMTATGFTWFFGSFANRALYLYWGPLVQLALTYPRGRRARTLDRVAVASGYAAALALPFLSQRHRLIAAILLTAVMLVAAGVGFAFAHGRERRERLAALEAAGFLGAMWAGVAVMRLASPGSQSTTLLVYEVALCLFAVALLGGLILAPWERSAVTDLVVELGETRSSTLRDALARALGDPSLEVGYWIPEDDGFVDSEGRRLSLPAPGSGRSTTTIERDGQPAAVLVHDPAVLNDPGLVEAVSAAAKLAAVNARLEAELRAHVDEVNSSRRRILEAGDEERERLERRLRGSAQRRLDALAKTLGEAHRSAAGDETVDRIARAETQLARTRGDIQQLALGINPRILTEQGLAKALASLVEESPVPVDLEVSKIDAPPSVEACAYFVCSEALANVAKHASASRARIVLHSNDSRLVIEVEDDGVGGADLERGSGLQGLADRVETLGGTLTVVSPPEGGTHLVAVMPTGSRPESAEPDQARWSA